MPVSDISHVVPCSISEKWNLNGADAVQLLFAILLYFHSEGFAAHLEVRSHTSFTLTQLSAIY